MKKSMLFVSISLLMANLIFAPHQWKAARQWDAISFDGVSFYDKTKLTIKIMMKRYGFSKKESKEILAGTYTSPRVSYHTYDTETIRVNDEP